MSDGPVSWIKIENMYQVTTYSITTRKWLNPKKRLETTGSQLRPKS